jgi:hypothetical protein
MVNNYIAPFTLGQMNIISLRYEVGIFIYTVDIIWLNGPFPCGSYNYIQISRHALKDHLKPGES